MVRWGVTVVHGNSRKATQIEKRESAGATYICNDGQLDADSGTDTVSGITDAVNLLRSCYSICWTPFERCRLECRNAAWTSGCCQCPPIQTPTHQATVHQSLMAEPCCPWLGHLTTVSMQMMHDAIQHTSQHTSLAGHSKPDRFCSCPCLQGSQLLPPSPHCLLLQNILKCLGAIQPHSIHSQPCCLRVEGRVLAASEEQPGNALTQPIQRLGRPAPAAKRTGG